MIGNVRLQAWDLGGHEEVRHIWQEFYVQVDAIIFVVDSADYERIQEAKHELHILLEEPALTGVPFLVLGNKSDLKSSLKSEQLINALGLNQDAILGARLDNGHNLRLFSCSLVEGHGYLTAFEVCYIVDNFIYIYLFNIFFNLVVGKRVVNCNKISKYLKY